MITLYHALNLTVLLSWAIASLLPWLVGFVTKMSTNATVKTLLLLALSAITSVATQWGDALANNKPFLWQVVVGVAVQNFVIAAVAHSHVWKNVALGNTGLTIASFFQVHGATDKVFVPPTDLNSATLQSATMPVAGALGGSVLDVASVGAPARIQPDTSFLPYPVTTGTPIQAASGDSVDTSVSDSLARRQGVASTPAVVPAPVPVASPVDAPAPVTAPATAG